MTAKEGTMIRQLMTSAMAAALVALAGPATAQGPYSIRGGPIYGGPIYGGGPSYFVGSYSQPYFGPQLSGAGFGVNYIGRFPQYNGYAANPPMLTGSPMVYYPGGVLYNPPPPPEPMGPPAPRPTNNQTSPGLSEGNQPAPGTPAAPSARPVQPAIGRASFSATLPPDAKLWVNDAPTAQTGSVRRFHTPANLDPLRTYEYLFRAQWPEGSQTVTRDKTVRFKAGDNVTVDFTLTTAR
jgi:uncharacterized protein (TIGR03000 family)